MSETPDHPALRAEAEGSPRPRFSLRGAARFAFLPAVTSPAAVAVFAVAVIAATSRLAGIFGMAWGWAVTGVLGAGVVARRLAPPQHAFAVLCATGAVMVFLWKPTFAPFELPFLVLLWLLRRRTAWFFAALLIGVLGLPKALFFHFPLAPGAWNWWSDTSSAHILLAGCLFSIEKRRGRLDDAGLPQWLAFFAGPTNPLNPMNFGPLDLWRPMNLDGRAVLRSFGLVAAKAGTLWLIDTRLAFALLGNLDYATLNSCGIVHLWGLLALNYVRLALYLSGTGDVVIVLLRLFGLPLHHPYRFALLAWNPVELWRRWSIYNRKLLLKTVYFPLGGAHRHRTLNVMATFLASAFIMHTGFVGSLHYKIGAAGWRDQGLYFFLQGFAVCVCLFFWRRRGKHASTDRDLRFSAGRAAATVVTQAYSTLVHLLIMAQHLGFGERIRLMGRCLGFTVDP